MLDYCMKKLLNIFAHIIFYITVFAAGYVTCCHHPSSTGAVLVQAAPKFESAPIPALWEIQQMIGARPDGIYGAETKTKWDQAICNQFGVKDYEKTVQ